MSCFGPNRLDAGRYRDRLLVRHRLHQLYSGLRVFGCVKRFHGRFTGAFTFAVLTFCIAFLDAGGIAQDEGGHFSCGLSGEYGNAMPAPGEQWQTASVVEVTVRQQHCIEFLFGSSWRPIQRLRFSASLKEPAIHKHARAFCLDVIGRAGDFATSGADSCDFHGVMVIRQFPARIMSSLVATPA